MTNYTETKLESEAIKSLGPLFKLTEVFLLDDGYSAVTQRASSFPKHIRFKYDDDDDEDDASGNIISRENSEDGIVMMEDMELDEQMSALGLPVVFQTSKQNRNPQQKGKIKITQTQSHHIEKRSEDQLHGSCRASEESLSFAESQDKSGNSSSSSLPEQTDMSCSGSCVSDEVVRLSSVDGVEKLASLARWPACNLPEDLDAELDCNVLEEHMLDCVAATITSNALDAEHLKPDSPMDVAEVAFECNLWVGNTCPERQISNRSIEQHQEMDLSFMQQEEGKASELGTSVMQIDRLGSCDATDHAQVVKKSDGMAVISCDNNDSVRCENSCGDWSAVWDSYYMRYYFYNSETQESTWYPPPGMESYGCVDGSLITSESNEEVPLNSVDTSVSIVKEVEQGDEYELVGKTAENLLAPNENCQDVSLTSSSLVRMEQSTYLKKEAQHVDSSDADAIYLSGSLCANGSGSGDDYVVACLSNTSSLTCADEAASDDHVIQDIPAATKRKKTKKSRKKKKGSNNSKGSEFQAVGEIVVDITKYWCQRYLLFSRFDDGIEMDDEGWFSVTPEAIARHQASRCGCGTVIDCFTGVGGNAIQFANTSKHVIAIDIDPKKIDYAHHNAAIYGVEDKIDFIKGDCFAVAPKLKADAVFLSPPWGGPNYLKVESYNINMLQPHDGQFLFNTFRKVASMIIMFLPRNVDVSQLAELALSANPPWSLEVERNFLNGKLKAVTAYFSESSV